MLVERIPRNAADRCNSRTRQPDHTGIQRVPAGPETGQREEDAERQGTPGRRGKSKLQMTAMQMAKGRRGMINARDQSRSGRVGSWDKIPILSLGE